MNRRNFIGKTAVISAAFVTGCTLRPRFDIVISNGQLVDGTGSPLQQRDIGIRDGRIIAIGTLKGATAHRIIDASGRMVAPGFIDIHTHTDVELLVDPRGESKLYQGVTTEVGGNCGSSYFPFNDDDFEETGDELAERYNLELTWRDADGFFTALEKRGVGINYATLVGHGQIRSAVVGKNDVQATGDQLKEMSRQLELALEQGCFGLSSGLEYAPGSYADTNELIHLCRLVAKYNRIYATHMRNEDDRVEEAIDEALRISKQSGVSLQISHLKACNRSNWHKPERFLKTLEQQSGAGIPVHADRYPYVAYGTGLSMFLPAWARQGTTDEILARLDDAKTLRKIRAYAEQRGERIGGWDRVLISSCFTDANKRWEGEHIQACSEKSGLSPFEFIIKLLKEERNRVGMVGFAMNEVNLKHVLQSPLVMIGSDGNAISPKGRLGEGKPHPRFYGTFPRVLGRYCRDEQLFDWPAAIRKMTSLPAEKLGLQKRGMLKEGYIADITIFDPQRIIDKATFTAPHVFAQGIDYVLINGKLVLDNGTHTGELVGEIIRSM